MDKKQYNNIIENTLKYEQSAQSDDSLATARAVFDNMGVALPSGDIKTVCETIKTNDYMGWRECSAEEAQEAANEGVAAIGISEDKIVVISATDEEEPVAQTASVMTLNENTSAFAGESMQYYVYNSRSTTSYLVDQLTGVQTFSYKKDGNKYLSENFQVKEFRSGDGADEILIDMDLVEYLQEIRDWAGGSITINSGYRTPSHNASVGGASGSQHLYGKAADIVCSNKTPLQLAQKAETLGIEGIEWNSASNYTHIDMRSKKWHVKAYMSDNKLKFMNVSSFYDSSIL